MMMPQFIKASPARHARVSGSTHGLAVWQAGQRSVPFYGQEARHLRSNNKKKRAGKPFPAPTDVTGYPRRRVSAAGPLHVCDQTPAQNPAPRGLCARPKPKQKGQFLFLMILLFSILIKTAPSLAFRSPSFTSVRHLPPSSNQ